MAHFKNMDTKPIICVVDDDPEVLDALSTLFGALDADIECYTSAEQFLLRQNIRELSCLLLEINLPGMNGLELLDHMNKMNYDIPIIAMATFSDVATAVQVMKGQVIDFIEKPFVDVLLARQVNNIIKKS